MCLGLSGGIDSALVAVIASDALGPNNVTAVMMPSRYSSTDSLTDAEQLIENLGIASIKFPIKDIHSTFSEEWALNLNQDLFGVTDENLQSRIRGVLLMAFANANGWLVLTTGNKSETAVGYSTLYGDTAGGFAVLKDVPKTWVYELAKYRNTISNVIPQRIIERPPSAELAPNQKDSDSLPEYKILDEIIELYVEKDLSLASITEKGFDEKTVKRVICFTSRD